MSDAIEKAKTDAFRAAFTLARRDPNLAGIVHDRCELAVLRRLVSKQLPGGEVEYWRLVEEEIRR